MLHTLRRYLKAVKNRSTPSSLLNPKSALATLATGLRMFSQSMGFNCDVEIIDTQIGGERSYYKSIQYGPKILNCYRLGRPFETLEDKIKEGDIHGISSDYTNSAQIVVDLAKFIKQLCPKSLTVVGGTDATARPNYYLQNGVDVVVKGEGEICLLPNRERLVQRKRSSFDTEHLYQGESGWMY